MDVFDALRENKHEQVVFCSDPPAGLRAIIVIHNTTLGPAIGGTRMMPYSSEEDALADALRLSRLMTFKAAAAGLNFGGGASVIIGDPKKDKSEALFRSLGRFIDDLNGRYISAEGMGTTVQDMDWVHMETNHVMGLTGASGDPSPMCAYGAYHGIRACVEEALNTTSLEGLKVAIQGVGNVGSLLVEMFAAEQCEIYVSEINRETLDRVREQYSVHVVDPEEIYDLPVDIFCPCALGGILNGETIPRLRCTVVAGVANNQLKEDRHGDDLFKRGILYAPDYVINAGGLINVAYELEGPYDEELAKRKTEAIYRVLKEIFAMSRQKVIPTHQAADRMAQQRIDSVNRLREGYFPSMCPSP